MEVLAYFLGAFGIIGASIIAPLYTTANNGVAVIVTLILSALSVIAAGFVN